ncbi:MAG: Ig-like domain-containing protein, partial [Planctomycetales bacterium]|nr:Ig-like domain-containing protein [Planctomycetales bacterium]
RTVTLTPTSVLANSTTYTVSVSTGVKDLAGNALQQAFTANFATVAAPPVDTTAPTVTSVTPTSGAMDVPTTVAPQIVFSEAMDAATINATTVRLLDGGSTVAATVSYNAATRTATLTPTAPLSNLKTYTVSVTVGVKDLAGNALAQTFTANFTVVALPVDTTAPTVTNVNPANGATNVATSIAPQVTFSEAMDAATINGNTVRLLNENGSVIGASVTYNAATRRVTITPLAALSTLQFYTVSIVGGANGVKDLAGNSLAQNYTSGFTTARPTFPRAGR